MFSVSDRCLFTQAMHVLPIPCRFKIDKTAATFAIHLDGNTYHVTMTGDYTGREASLGELIAHTDACSNGTYGEIVFNRQIPLETQLQKLDAVRLILEAALFYTRLAVTSHLFRKHLHLLSQQQREQHFEQQDAYSKEALELAQILEQYKKLFT